LLVTGAGGALGGFALELAAIRGLRTLAVAGPGDEELARQLGANEFITRTDNLGSAVRSVLPGGVDGVLDAALIGMPALEAVRDGGSFVAVSAGAAPAPLRGTRVHNVWIQTDAPALAELSALADAGRLTLRIAAAQPLEDVAAAHERVAAGGVRGRIVLKPND
jgi:NADPH2:quinone reductase